MTDTKPQPEAAQAGIGAAAKYDRVLKATARADSLPGYPAFSEAWLGRHQPALRRCAEREGQ